ncbi:MAG: nucleotidyltransferase family protein [Candidatus Aceula meridiana]|nr:nucleotidyltransferase family protein [Candidatus Aceula meridiana]
MQDLSLFDVVVLAGGLGKRLRPTTGDAPKVLAEVDGTPFLDILLKNLYAQGFRRVILCTGYKADEIEAHYQKNSLGLEIIFSKEETPLGTGGAIKNARDKVQSPIFFALNGDCFCSVSFSDFFKFYQAQGAKASLVLSKLENKNDFGSVVVDSSNQIVSFEEKSSSSASPYASVGIYCFDREVFDWMPEAQAFSIETEFFPKLVGKNFFGFITENKFLDIGTPERYKTAQEKLKNK